MNLFFNRWFRSLSLDADGGGAGGDSGDGEPEFYPWTEQLPDKHKTHERAKGVKSVGAVFDDLLVAEAKVTDLEGRLPKVPEKAEEYEFGKPDYPKGYEADAEFDTAFRTKALEQGLTAAQADALYQHFASTVIGQYNAAVAAAEKAKTDADEALKKVWPGDEYAKNMILKDRFMAAFAEGNDERKAMFDETGIGNNPEFIKMAVDIAKKVGEDVLGPGGPKPGEPKSEGKEAQLRAMYPKSKDLPMRHEPGSPTAGPSEEDLKKMYPSQTTEG